MTRSKIIEKNEFGIKRTDNRLCLLCRKYVLKKDWKKHLPKCEELYKAEKNLEAKAVLK